MSPARERNVMRMLHLVLSIPIIGFIYGPVATIPRAVWFTRYIAVPVVVLSGVWLWLKPKVKRWVRERGRSELLTGAID
jgi:hypothetical protein